MLLSMLRADGAGLLTNESRHRHGWLPCVEGGGVASFFLLCSCSSAFANYHERHKGWVEAGSNKREDCLLYFARRCGLAP
jgi:hypothetical protein